MSLVGERHRARLWDGSCSWLIFLFMAALAVASRPNRQYHTCQQEASQPKKGRGPRQAGFEKPDSLSAQ